MSETLPLPGSRKIGLFGGAFDPVHVGHQRVARTIIEKGVLDEVWFVPVYEHPWAAKLGKSMMSEYADRKVMVELTIKELGGIVPKSKVESQGQERIKLAEYKAVSYAYTTLTHFAQQFPEITFSWIMGSEYLGRFPEFLELHPKLTEFTFCIYPREGFPLEPLTPNMVALRDVEQVQVSSTQIRELVRAGKPITALVVPQVAEYIAAHRLYPTREV